MLIYMATSLTTGKSYIGQTVKTLNQRKSEHKHRALYEEDYKNAFHNAIRKYGFDDFQWIILEESENWTHEILDEKEKEYIQFYDTLNNGYNILQGGQGDSRLDGDTMAIQCGSKPFYAFNLKGELIGEFVNKKQFEYDYGIPTSRILEMIKNTTLSSKGIIIIDKESYKPEILQFRLKNCIKKQSFYAECIETKEITGPYSNIEECKRILNLPKSCHITEVLKGSRKSSNGYKFIYCE